MIKRLLYSYWTLNLNLKKTTDSLRHSKKIKNKKINVVVRLIDKCIQQCNNRHGNKHIPMYFLSSLSTEMQQINLSPTHPPTKHKHLPQSPPLHALLKKLVKPAISPLQSIEPCNISHVGRRNNTIYLLWEMKSIVMPEIIHCSVFQHGVCRR